ncbi:pyridoxal 5'-phosphate synthase glutaminase subunit PdxT [Microbacterium sp. SORGH_AS_0888]|uniref:pyridoxal 5'-phosphate synthase glutaminase subunit PdxT n=1 Tax=Microbacterium sp. SORGH_AS_0888 TaxID=3041791 RepID=UPI00277DA795|nr:pyridoxal 5'-phosphate synthase glutaminase subunit PdxT [Microbacterium sp. SORGH_AS_0888]MDQ1128550.1 5'-phosphate synthase pdxT subunit [Microbacterium sp. SORGH_AS_0888]
MAGSPARVGVLALQGDVREHVRVLSGLGADPVLVRRPEELAAVSGLVLPGGESSVIDKLSRSFGMREPIRQAIADGMPMYGTCAGLILLADRIENPIAGQLSFGGLDVTVRRNAFGSQADSFETALAVVGFDEPAHATFIRAPLVVQVGDRAQPLAELPDGGVVAVRQGVLLGTAFHPEVAGDIRFHRLFLDTVQEQRR